MKTKNEVWMQFASTALSTALSSLKRRDDIPALTSAAAEVADYMTAEWEKRQEQPG